MTTPETAPARRDRPALLILCFSDIANDARVKKQVALFADRYRVTTCGFGDPYRDDVEHIRLDAEVPLAARRIEAVLLRSRLYRAAYARHPHTRAARAALRGRSFDAVVANDIDTVGLAVELFGGERVHADLHEFFPGLHDQVEVWNRIRRPYLQHLIRRDATRVASATTVSATIAERYRDEFGVPCGVVQNASPIQGFVPGPVGSPIRIVHSGGAQANRRIEVMMEAVARSSADLTLDLFLTGAGTPYAEGLRRLADELGERVTVHPPVPQAELLGTLNRFDVGIHVLPATNTNNALALPNKFFDYVQARLGMVIGPTADMVRLLEQHELGAVAAGFEVDDVVAALDGLTRERVEAWKSHAHAAAAALSAEAQEHVWRDAVEAIAGRGLTAQGPAGASDPNLDSGHGEGSAR